ncbi:MAG: YceI family protein [Sphingomonadales bacterium]|nr:YceI family protein [Sphingomonadales bacterium]
MKQNWKLFSLFTAFSLVLLIYPPSIHAQSKYMTRNGLIRFEAEGPIKDDIKAINNQGGCVLDAATGDILFKIPIKSFVFRKALMQEHFNENYMESHKFPTAELRGKIEGFSQATLQNSGVRQVVVAGKMTVHGVTRDTREKGTLEVKDGKILLRSDFVVALADYGINIPKIVEDKLAKVAQVNLSMDLVPVGQEPQRNRVE